jgi:zinc D-Ala-D-Ala dipeptidase
MMLLYGMVLAIISAVFMIAAFTEASPAAGSSQPKEFVYLREIDSSIIQDVRYAGMDNFTGKPVPGYGAAECLLLRPVAEALKRVQTDLRNEGLSLKVYDCYRPNRAVQAFVQWASDGIESESTKRFYPRLKKSELLPGRFISGSSGHSRGIAVDLTLVRLPAASQEAFDPKRLYGSCIGPARERTPDNAVDMGTGFDCFDPNSHTASSEISPEQRRSRDVLVFAMERHRFKNYAGEWWHFTFQMPSFSELRSYDFPILPRPSSTPAKNP